jgi:Ca-activated chloride channel homolog
MKEELMKTLLSFICLLSLAALLSACGTAATSMPPVMIAGATGAPVATSAAVATAAGPAHNNSFPPTPFPTPSWRDGKTGSFPKVNPPVDTAEDHLSTFSLDVDTASYTIARQALLSGIMPAADAIRPEEFINYFHQDYALPADLGFAVYADGAPSPFSSHGTYFLRIGIQGYDIPSSQRKPLSLVFVLDTSGSMGDSNKLDMVKESLQMLVRRLRPQDSVAIVAYSDSARVILDSTRGSDHNTIMDAIDTLDAEGSTNLRDGLMLGYQVASESNEEGTNRRVILCTDGVANVGDTDPQGILEDVHKYSTQGITLTAIGVGMGDYNDKMLEQLADRGNGNYYHVDTPDEAHRVFVEKMVATMQVIAKNAKVQVDFNQDTVAEYRLIGYEDRAIADNNFRNDNVDAGEIGAGHSATAVYAIRLNSHAQGRLATVQLRWQDPDTADVLEINGNINSWDLANRFEDASPRFQLSVLAAEFAELLRQSPYREANSYSSLSHRMDSLMESLGEDQDVQEFDNLISAACRLNPWQN